MSVSLLSPPAAPQSPTSVGGFPLVARLFAELGRDRFEWFIQHSIDFLDLADGDPDEEDEPEGDLLDEHGEWEVERPQGVKLPLPIYGIDQSAGPLNEREVRAWAAHRGLMNAGMQGSL